MDVLSSVAGGRRTAFAAAAARNLLPSGDRNIGATAREDYGRELELSRLSRENARLLDALERLRIENEDLRGSARFWIRLYESQLTRAKAGNAAPEGK